MNIDAQNTLLSQLIAENPDISIKEYLDIVREIEAIENAQKQENGTKEKVMQTVQERKTA